MGDFEETNFFWKSVISPGKRKRKKDSRNKDLTMKTDESIKEKKKKTKEAGEKGKAKERKKKKKKEELALELGDSFIFTQAGSAQAKPTVSPQALDQGRNDELLPDYLNQDSKKKSKRIKKVAFELSPGFISEKHPKSVSSSLQCPEDCILSEIKIVKDSKACSQVAAIRDSQQLSHDNNSQSTSEDINSQDLFITQKTHRVSPSQPSSGEAFEVFKEQDTPDASIARIEQHVERSYTDSYVDQHQRKTNKHVKKMAQALHTEKEEEVGVNKAHREHKKRNLPTQMELNANPTMVKKENPYLVEPIVVNSPPDFAKKPSKSSRRRAMMSTATQTENMFTTELSSYLSFCQKHIVSTYLEDLEPLDLSLPKGARKDLGTCVAVKILSVTAELKGDKPKDSKLHVACPSDMKEVRKKCSVSTKVEATPSPQSESDPKSADTTTSSEDNESLCRTGRQDLSKVRAVQMRLNESFFFKPKGEVQSPRPQSPLMKLAQSRPLRGRKRH